MKVYSLQLQQDPTDGVGIRQLNPAKVRIKKTITFSSLTGSGRLGILGISRINRHLSVVNKKQQKFW